MTIRRLRPAYDDETLRQVYSQKYDHTRWEDHIQRIEASIGYIHDWTTPDERRTVADLSCGDGALAKGIRDTTLLLLGDYVNTGEYQSVGRIEETVLELDRVDLFVLSETLEHIDDPLTLLTSIRQYAMRIFISTPLDERDDANPEHYWGWDADGVRSLLVDAGWNPTNVAIFTPDVPQVYYTYQFWLAE